MLLAGVAAPRAPGLAARFFRGTVVALGGVGCLARYRLLCGIFGAAAKAWQLRRASCGAPATVRQLRREGVLMSVGLREDFGGC